MLTLLLRHYRRFAVFSGGLALFCAAELAGSGLDLSLLGYVGIFFVSFIVFSMVAVGVYAVIPRYRGLLEITGFAAFATSALLFYASKYGFDSLLHGIGGGVILLLLTGLVWAGLHSKLSRKIGAETTWRDRYSGHVPYPARLIWRHVIPGAAEPSDHCTGMMARYDEDEEDPDTVHVTFKGRKDRAAKYTLTFLERDQPSACRFFFQGTEADGTVVDGIFSLRTTVLERNTCFLSCVEERSGLSIGSLVERWFDDSLGYQHDKLLEMLDARYGETYGIRKSSMLATE
ncbi:hypothetical protein SAMN05444273_101450 [Litoreibacter ascidiaceicola]|uniref:Uncharacterized protein n=1 Tax=Litoreibacter ascidiaceicola TaxID=1486859 RepID=A0A1M4TKX4_9RHOB|nr:hypothetical protein [Litoreibacter ascidiaceicola]SHE45045.1 hypothetical protein SAMN05444273_101450 [Litoreibacter ascidiaceicola]